MNNLIEGIKLNFQVFSIPFLDLYIFLKKIMKSIFHYFKNQLIALNIYLVFPTMPPPFSDPYPWETFENRPVFDWTPNFEKFVLFSRLESSRCVTSCY